MLIENGHAQTARRTYYTGKRKNARANALIGATINMFSDYLGDRDWKVYETQTRKSVNGLNNYVKHLQAILAS